MFPNSVSITSHFFLKSSKLVYKKICVIDKCYIMQYSHGHFLELKQDLNKKAPLYFSFNPPAICRKIPNSTSFPSNCGAAPAHQSAASGNMQTTRNLSRVRARENLTPYLVAKQITRQGQAANSKKGKEKPKDKQTHFQQA